MVRNLFLNHFHSQYYMLLSMIEQLMLDIRFRLKVPLFGLTDRVTKCTI